MATPKEMFILGLFVMITLFYMPFWFLVICLQAVSNPLKKVMKWLENLAYSVTEIL